MKRLPQLFRPFVADPSSHQRHWEKVYLSNAPTDVSWFQDRPAVSLTMIAAAGLDERGWIVDVGGGSSSLVDHLWAEGFRNLTVLDVSFSALGHAMARLGQIAGNVEWVVSDLTSWEPQRHYDLWHDRAVFHFLTTEEDRAAYKVVLERALPPGGHMVIATFALDGPAKCSGLAVQRYSFESLAAELGPAFVLQDTAAEEHVTPSEHKQKFVYCRFRRI